MCLPNENLTQLLEFCYSHSKIRIQEGMANYRQGNLMLYILNAIENSIILDEQIIFVGRGEGLSFLTKIPRSYHLLQAFAYFCTNDIP